MDPNTLFYFSLILTGANCLFNIIILAVVLDLKDESTRYYYKRR